MKIHFYNSKSSKWSFLFWHLEHWQYKMAKMTIYHLCVNLNTWIAHLRYWQIEWQILYYICGQLWLFRYKLRFLGEHFVSIILLTAQQWTGSAIQNYWRICPPQFSKWQMAKMAICQTPYKKLTTNWNGHVPNSL